MYSIDLNYLSMGENDGGHEELVDGCAVNLGRRLCVEEYPQKTQHRLTTRSIRLVKKQRNG